MNFVVHKVCKLCLFQRFSFLKTWWPENIIKRKTYNPITAHISDKIIFIMISFKLGKLCQWFGKQKRNKCSIFFKGCPRIHVCSSLLQNIVLSCYADLKLSPKVRARQYFYWNCTNTVSSAAQNCNYMRTSERSGRGTSAEASTLNSQRTSRLSENPLSHCRSHNRFK